MLAAEPHLALTDASSWSVGTYTLCLRRTPTPNHCSTQADCESSLPWRRSHFWHGGVVLASTDWPGDLCKTRHFILSTEFTTLHTAKSKNRQPPPQRSIAGYTTSFGMLRGKRFQVNSRVKTSNRGIHHKSSTIGPPLGSSTLPRPASKADKIPLRRESPPRREHGTSPARSAPPCIVSFSQRQIQEPTNRAKQPGMDVIGTCTS